MRLDSVRFRTTFIMIVSSVLVLSTNYVSAGFEDKIREEDETVINLLSENYKVSEPQFVSTDNDILSMIPPKANLENLNDFLFVGDSFTAILQGTIKRNTDNVYVHAKSGSAPSYWLNKVDDMPDNSKVKGVVLLIGVNGASTDANKRDVKTLISSLANKYHDKTIYVQKVFPTGLNFKTANPTSFNRSISTLNEIISAHCETIENVRFINTQDGFVDSNGYLIHSNDGLHISESYNQQFYDNIFKAVKETK